MLNEQELIALVQLLNRCPMSQAELMWVQALINKLRPAMAQPKQKEEATDDKQANS